MTVMMEHERVVLFRSDCLEMLRSLPDNSLDSLVTDPPSGIGFMGKSWDKDKGGRVEWVAWLASIMRECRRVLKPGAWALVWALPRTAHWTAWAIEDAGFEVRDVVLHLFGTGFPKSLTSASAEIPEWAGTALKPAAEHWILARKAPEGTVGETFAEHGTGVLNIGACKIGEGLHGGQGAAFGAGWADGSGLVKGYTPKEPAPGRWPANVTLDEEAAEVLDTQSGVSKSQGPGTRCSNRDDAGKCLGHGNDVLRPTFHGPEGAKSAGDSGGASRFFYVAKPTKREKDAGLDHLPVKSGGEATDREDGSDGLKSPRAGAGRGGGSRNSHPTVKSISLMRWLVRLVTPPGGVVLDAFAGSGSTGVAAIAEGFSFVGCEREEEYAVIAQGRLEHALKGAA